MQERVLGRLKPATRQLVQRVAEEARTGGPVTVAPNRTLKPGVAALLEKICAGAFISADEQKDRVGMCEGGVVP